MLVSFIRFFNSTERQETRKREKVPWREVVLFQYVEMKEGWSQTHSDVHGCHLVLLHRWSDITEETQQGLQDFSVFIRHQHDSRLHSLQPLILWYICTCERMESFYFCFERRLREKILKCDSLDLKKHLHSATWIMCTYFHSFIPEIKSTSTNKKRLTLVDVEESLPKFAGEQRLRQISEKLLHHVGHIVGRLILVVHIVWRALIHLPESLDSGLHPWLTKETHLQGEREEFVLTQQPTERGNYLYNMSSHYIGSLKPSYWISTSQSNPIPYTTKKKNTHPTSHVTCNLSVCTLCLTWSRHWLLRYRSACCRPSGNGCPERCTCTIRGTPNTFLSL